MKLFFLISILSILVFADSKKEDLNKIEYLFSIKQYDEAIPIINKLNKERYGPSYKYSGIVSEYGLGGIKKNCSTAVTMYILGMQFGDCENYKYLAEMTKNKNCVSNKDSRNKKMEKALIKGYYKCLRK